MDKFNYWQQGRLLQTTQTKKWSKEERLAAHNEELCMVFKYFSDVDQGRSREFITRCQSSDQAAKVVHEHNALMDAYMNKCNSTKSIDIMTNETDECRKAFEKFKQGQKGKHSNIWALKDVEDAYNASRADLLDVIEREATYMRREVSGYGSPIYSIYRFDFLCLIHKLGRK